MQEIRAPEFSFSVSVILALPRWRPAEQDYFFAFFKASKEKREAGVSSSVSRLSRPSPASVARLKNAKFCKPAGISVFPKRVMP